MVKHPSTHGFTLMELLVTVTIIAILIGMLIPVLQQVREASQRLLCRGRQHQIGQAYVAFAADHNGMAVNTREVRESYTDDPALVTGTRPMRTWDNPESAIQWYELLGPFLGEERDRAATDGVRANVFRCPTYHTADNPWNWIGGGGSRAPQYDNHAFGYAINARLGRAAGIMKTDPDYRFWKFNFRENDLWNPGSKAYDLQYEFRLARIANATKRVLLIDSNMVKIAIESGPTTSDYDDDPACTTWHFNPSDVNDPLLNSSALRRSDAQFPEDRHHGRLNALFCDGHVGNFMAATDGLDFMRSVCFPSVAQDR